MRLRCVKMAERVEVLLAVMVETLEDSRNNIVSDGIPIFPRIRYGLSQITLATCFLIFNYYSFLQQQHYLPHRLWAHLITICVLTNNNRKNA